MDHGIRPTLTTQNRQFQGSKGPYCKGLSTTAQATMIPATIYPITHQPLNLLLSSFDSSLTIDTPPIKRIQLAKKNLSMILIYHPKPHISGHLNNKTQQAYQRPRRGSAVFEDLTKVLVVILQLFSAQRPSRPDRMPDPEKAMATRVCRLSLTAIGNCDNPPYLSSTALRPHHDLSTIGISRCFHAICELQTVDPAFVRDWEFVKTAVMP